MKKSMTLQGALERIEQITQLLEEDQTQLEESLTLFAEATELIAFCNKKMQSAQLQIEKLSAPEKKEENQDVSL